MNGDGTTVTYLTFKPRCTASPRGTSRGCGSRSRTRAPRGATTAAPYASTDARSPRNARGGLEPAGSSGRPRRRCSTPLASLGFEPGTRRTSTTPRATPCGDRVDGTRTRRGFGGTPAREDVASAAETSRRAARHDLCVLLCQSDHRDDDAVEELRSMGYRYRLSEEVLRYDLDYGAKVPRNKGGDGGAREVREGVRRRDAGFRAVAPAKRFLRGEPVLVAWVPRARMRFFSYAHRLPWNAEDVGSTHPLRSTMDAIVRRVWRVAAAAFRAREATSAEWWAHCGRTVPVTSYFDSDDEGEGTRGDSAPDMQRRRRHRRRRGSHAGDGSDGCVEEAGTEGVARGARPGE